MQKQAYFAINTKTGILFSKAFYLSADKSQVCKYISAKRSINNITQMSDYYQCKYLMFFCMCMAYTSG